MLTKPQFIMHHKNIEGMTGPDATVKWTDALASKGEDSAEKNKMATSFFLLRCQRSS